MDNLFTNSIKLVMVFMLLAFSTVSFSQSSTLSREEAAIKRAEDRLEGKRLKLVDYKIQIEKSDSLFDAGDALMEKSEIEEKQAKQEIKSLEKTYKVESKNSAKAMKNKDRKVASEARKENTLITTKYRADLKVLENKKANAARNVMKGDRMMAKADKKLGLLADRLKTAEKSYKDAEKLLNEAQNGK